MRFMVLHYKLINLLTNQPHQLMLNDNFEVVLKILIKIIEITIENS